MNARPAVRHQPGTVLYRLPSGGDGLYAAIPSGAHVVIAGVVLPDGTIKRYEVRGGIKP
jgi:hypothetical protein